MTPTFSSLQSVPSTKSTKAESSNAWMKSAAKRVGFRRNGDGTPRSKKEGPPKELKTISFPDKVRLRTLTRQVADPISLLRHLTVES